jgi:dephospho-CoA kinase
MMLLGITGGIGAGKSTVAQVFATLGIPVLAADALAKRILATNAHVKAQIIQLLGVGAYVDHNYQAAYVSQKVFSNTSLLQQLNQIVHPVVHAETKAWLEKQQGPYALYEAALLQAQHKSNLLQKIIYVYAPTPVRVQRVLVRDQKTEAQIQKIIASQATELDYRSVSDFEIQNDGSQPIIPQVLAIHKNLS